MNPTWHETLHQLEDFRQINKCKYRLGDLLLLGLCTYLCNGQDYEDMVLFTRHRAAELTDLLDLRGRVPSHDTFNRAFQRIDPQVLRTCLATHGQELLPLLAEKQICVDGKKIKGVSPTSKGTAGYWLVNAWVSENRLCVGQCRVADKANELEAVPQVLAQLDLTEAVVTLDAMGCQRAVAAQIRQQKGHYLLALKQNHKTLFQDVADAFARSPTPGVAQPWEYARSRFEQRQVWCLPAAQVLGPEQLAAWSGRQTVVKVAACRTEKGQTQRQTRYYLSDESEINPLYYGKLAQGHWSIENHLHWHLDVTFREDECRVRTGFGPENLATLRKIALQIINRQTDKLSLQKRRVQASYQGQYLRQLIA